jgi:hypothetical protein
MYDPHENKFVPVDESAIATLPHPQRDWTRFQEGETVDLKGISFNVHEVGESRIVLKPIKKV